MGTWNEQDIVTLARYLADGLSASEIGALMNISRNAVIGKVHRTKGMAFEQKKPGRHPAKKKPSPIREKKVAQVQPTLAPEPPPVGPEGGVHIMDLEHHHCRAVTGQGDDGLARFCGAPKEGFVRTRAGSSVPSAYCTRHGDLYYNRAR